MQYRFCPHNCTSASPYILRHSGRLACAAPGLPRFCSKTHHATTRDIAFYFAAPAPHMRILHCFSTATRTHYRYRAAFWRQASPSHSPRAPWLIPRGRRRRTWTGTLNGDPATSPSGATLPRRDTTHPPLLPRPPPARHLPLVASATLLPAFF